MNKKIFLVAVIGICVLLCGFTSVRAITERDNIEVVLSLQKTLSENKGDNAECAKKVREIIGDSWYFEDDDVVEFTENLITLFKTSFWGGKITDTNSIAFSDDKAGNREIVIDSAAGFNMYDVKYVEEAEGEMIGDGCIDYDGALGKYRIKIVLYNVDMNNSFNTEGFYDKKPLML